MTGPGRLRVGAAALLLASGVAFLIGSSLERAGHHETAAQHALEVGAAPVTAPVAAPTVSPSNAPVIGQSPRPASVRPAPSPTKDTRLTAPEGSKAKEAGERAARETKASPSPTRPAVTATAASARPAVAAVTSSPTPTQAAEGSAARESAERSPGASAPGTVVPASESSERLFGINPESTSLTAGALAVTAVLALLLLLLPSRRLRRLAAGAAVLFCLGASALDLREITHQNMLGRTGIVAVAAVVLLLHVAAAAFSGVLVARHPSTLTQPEPRTS